MGRRANWEAAKERFPSHQKGTDHWEAFFDIQPGVMYSMLGDIAKVYMATDDTVRRVGRRPGVEMSLEQLERIISPRYAIEPLSISLPALIAGRSRRAFALRVPCHHSTLQRFIDGSLVPTRSQLEALARAGRVGPAYFAEWRLLFAAEAMAAVYAKHPNMSIAAYKMLTGENHATVSR